MWTYDSTKLSTQELMQVRLEIQDNVQARPLLQDEEINYLITQERNLWGACARCCELIARSFLSKADTRLGRSLLVQYVAMAKQYKEMTADFLRKKSAGTTVPYVGGMFLSDKQAYERGNSLVQPAFGREMLESPWAGHLTSDQSTTTNPNPSVAGI